MERFRAAPAGDPGAQSAVSREAAWYCVKRQDTAEPGENQSGGWRPSPPLRLREQRPSHPVLRIQSNQAVPPATLMVFFHITKSDRPARVWITSIAPPSPSQSPARRHHSLFRPHDANAMTASDPGSRLPMIRDRVRSYKPVSRQGSRQACTGQEHRCHDVAARRGRMEREVESK